MMTKYQGDQVKYKSLHRYGMFVAVALIIFIGFSNMNLMSADNKYNLQVSAEAITVTYPDGEAHSVRFDSIVSIKCLDDFSLQSFGRSVRGGEEPNMAWGEWENDLWGVYSICVLKKVESAIVIQTADGGRFVFNYSNASDTVSLYQGICDLLGSASTQDQ